MFGDAGGIFETRPPCWQGFDGGSSYFRNRLFPVAICVVDVDSTRPVNHCFLCSSCFSLVSIGSRRPPGGPRGGPGKAKECSGGPPRGPRSLRGQGQKPYFLRGIRSGPVFTCDAVKSKHMPGERRVGNFHGGCVVTGCTYVGQGFTNGVVQMV